MSFIKSSPNLRIYWASFTLFMVFVAFFYLIYGLNIFKWQDSPDFGWWAMHESGPNVVAETMKIGKEAGLRIGDKIQSINGRTYSTFDELYFKTRNDEPGSVNIYTVIRDGRPVEISITTGRLGLKGVMSVSGPLFGMSIIYIIIGILIFLMKPQAKESWIFLIMTCFLGLFLSYSTPSYLMHPLWLYDVRRLFELIFPATLIHLSLRFPKTRTILLTYPWFWTIPYIFSIILFVLFKITSPAFWEANPVLFLFSVIYLLLSILIFLGSMVWNFLKERSMVVRLQSQVIFVGSMIGFLLPCIDLLLRNWDTYLFPHPDLGIGFSLIFFPLSIGYTIVKHDLFAIDVIVRRTYGYLLSTTAIIGSYALIVSLLNVTFHSSEISRSPVFSIVFALSVVFFFRPLHERFQGFIDRVFYRQRYDYRKTIKDISEAMTSILDPQQIHRTLIGSLVKEMFLENGLLLLPNPSENIYHVNAVESGNAEKLGSIKMRDDDELLRVIQKKNDAVFRTEVDLNPRYDNNREALQQTFQSFDSELMLPMKYKNEMRGIISLGGKKSGKMFTPEDIDLIKTLTSQSVIALENAKLFQENLEKGRMEEELKIAHDIQISMLPETAPTIEGFKIAATSIPAKEVGGDFYDFHNISGEGKLEKLGIVVGDVSGKAVSGALVMAASRSVFRVLSETHSSVEEIMKKGNVRLKNDVKKGMFVALLYAVLDSRERTITLSNAGQTQPVLCSGDKKPFYIDTDGDRFPLGIVKDCDYQETTLPLNRGDTVVLYTDGIVESMNEKKELYGFDRFLTSIDKSRHLNANDMLRKLVDDVSSYVGDTEQHDDLTIVVLTVA